jgi:hypothetical protein
MFEGDFPRLFENIKLFGRLFYQQGGIILIIIFFVSLILMFLKKQFHHLLFWSMISITNILYAVNYSIPDIEAYYIPFFLSVSGVLFYAQRSYNVKTRLIFSSVISVIAVFTIVSTYSERDRSKDTFAQDLAKSFLEPLPEKSILLVEEWDVFAPARYLQRIEGFRNDVVMIDYALLKRSWYLSELLRVHPENFSLIKQDIDEFVAQVTLFENNRPYNTLTLETAYRKMIDKMIKVNESNGYAVFGHINDPVFKRSYPSVPYFITREYSTKGIPSYRKIQGGDSFIKGYNASSEKDPRKKYLLHSVLSSLKHRNLTLRKRRV